MRTYLLCLTSLLLFLASACSAPQPAAAPQPDFRPTSTIKDIMHGLVEPNADFLWNAVATVSGEKGVEEKAPKTDEDWDEVRNHAVALLESTNLILVPGRLIARPGEKTGESKEELSPEQIETLVNQDRLTWTKLTHGLYDATANMMKAIEAKDTQALLDRGDGIDKACENCHLKYWYPNEGKEEKEQK